MKKTLRFTLASLGVVVCVTSAVSTQAPETQRPRYEASYFALGAGTKQVTISTRAGQVLSVIDIPTDVALSIHLVKGEFVEPTNDNPRATFSGAVSVRTRPRSDVVPGPMMEQMMVALFRLDVEDATVVVTQQRQ